MRTPLTKCEWYSSYSIQCTNIVTGTVVSLQLCLQEFFSNVCSGMRGIKALIWEPSVLDAEEGTSGFVIEESHLQIPRYQIPWLDHPRLSRTTSKGSRWKRTIARIIVLLVGEWFFSLFCCKFSNKRVGYRWSSNPRTSQCSFRRLGCQSTNSKVRRRTHRQMSKVTPPNVSILTRCHRSQPRLSFR